MNQMYEGTTAARPKNCLNCVHHQYEENQEEIEVLVCFLRRKLIDNPNKATNCPSYYTANMDMG